MEFPTYAVLSIIKWKKYFYLFAIKPGYCELKLKKKRFRLLVSRIRCFQLYCTKNMCSLIFCKIALFPALLQREKMFCKAATSHADFYLTLLKTTFWLVFLLGSATFTIIFPFPLCSLPNYTFDALYYQKNALVCWQLN